MSGHSLSGARPEEKRPPASLRVHEQAGLVPAMTAAEYEALKADIGERGLLSPLEISAEGVVLDGRHRLRVAAELGLGSVLVRVVEPRDELEHMLLAAIARRQLSASQKAALAVDLKRCREQREAAQRLQRANLRHSLEVAVLPPRGEKTRETAERLAGCSPRLVQDAFSVQAVDPALLERVKAGELTVGRARRQLERAARDARLPASPPLPEGPFQLIYADPPWQLGNPGSSYAPENYYPTLPLAEIMQLPAPAADDALLYLWAVNSHLPEALEVMAAWGFTYRSNEVWVKPSIGMGVWTRNRHELLLIGRRGTAGPPDPKNRLGSVIEFPRGRHSQKPACVYERLEQFYPQLSKLELFARGKPRPGWSVWGNEAEAA
jgi:N6-adenosine-specific RNA methylase IME4/ParB-like chromosome segregation protein Spo0J